MGVMSLRIDFWNKLNKQAEKNRQYKSLFKALRAIHPGSVLLLRAPSDEPWLGQLIKRGQLSPGIRLNASAGVANDAIKTPAVFGSWSRAP